MEFETGETGGEVGPLPEGTCLEERLRKGIFGIEGTMKREDSRRWEGNRKKGS